MEHGDAYIVILLLLVGAVWGWFYVRRKGITFSFHMRKIGQEVASLPTDVIDFLEFSGYEIIGGKHKIPISIEVDGHLLQTRLFIDGYAKLDQEIFLVRVARERKPLEWTGSGIREYLLPYYLLYPQAAGILYVNIHMRTIKTITFDIEAS